MPEIVLECKPDEALIKKLGYTRKMITHQPSKGEVINYIRKNPDTVGIVDEDPGSAVPSYFKEFRKDGEDKFMIVNMFIPHNKTRLIVIKPRLEEWILNRAVESKIDLGKHWLPADGHQLHKIINTRLQRFENMIMEMLENKDKGLLYLKKIIDIG